MGATGSESSVIFLGQSNGSDSENSAAICLQDNLNPTLRLKLAQSLQGAVSRNTNLQKSFASMLNEPAPEQFTGGFAIFNFLIKKSERGDPARARCLTKRVAAAIALLDSPLRRQAISLLIEVAHIHYKQLPKGGEAAANFARQYVYRANMDAMRGRSVAA